jgi:hypothetical protein
MLDFIDKVLEEEIQLHEQFQLIYVVDGYYAEFSPDDGNTWYSFKGETPINAIELMCKNITGRKEFLSKGKENTWTYVDAE